MNRLKAAIAIEANRIVGPAPEVKGVERYRRGK